MSDSRPPAADGALPPSVSLSQLLIAPRAKGAPVAFARGREESFADLVGRVEALARQLRHHIARQRGSRFLLLARDSYDFATGFLAIARAGGVALLPPNRQPGSLARLLPTVTALVGDFSSEEAAGLPVLDPREVDPLPFAARGDDAGLDPSQVVAELFTSGSTGEAKHLEKALSHLESEVRTLEETLGPMLASGPARVFATVSHQHLYGLLFRVLWPLCSGRPFAAETPLHPEELLPRMAGAERCLLVATPVHLRRMIHRPELGELRGRLVAVFSSGGPLDRETALGVTERLGSAPIEIFGSTETGGVAWRRQHAEGEAPWSTLPGVEIALESDGRLRVRSPFVSDGGSGEGFVMGDRVEIAADGTFALRGRADRVIKVGEKRLSLPEMESALRTHAWIEEVALVPLEQAGETRVGAVVVLDESARQAAQRDRRSVLAAFSEHLAPDWDRVLLPRAWRLVDELPRDAQGKLPTPALQALFESRARPRIPNLEVQERSASRLVLAGRVPEDLAALEGHFPGHPIVPGVAQLVWVRDAAAGWLGRAPELRAVEALKFAKPLLPGHEFRLHLERGPEGDSLRFRFERTGEDGEPVLSSSGRLALGAEEPEA
ncbi:MAG: AMP-binding protein [Myxococcota bacterium]|nr:AMP-binding protein [Myxococcota bacterium]